MRENDTRIGGPHTAFPKTRRSAVYAVSSPDQAQRRWAADVIIAAYWKPAYKYIRLKFGFFNEDAKDLTQDFFTGLAAGLFLAFLVAAMPNPDLSRHYYLEIMIPGGIVGLIVGIATQQRDFTLRSRALDSSRRRRGSS